MIDLEKLRESAELFKSKDLQMGVNPEALLELLDHITKLEASETKLITERAELACAAMEAVDMLWDDDSEGAYEHLVENFEDIYNET